jgi:phenylacetic acid degradation operon negative regulatory protein
LDQERNIELDLRPLTARSVLLSVLLGTAPPRLPASRLVRAGGLFGISEGAARTALSRLLAAGEVVVEDGWYGLADRLVRRQARQDASRADQRLAWTGAWELAVVYPDRRPAAERAELRTAMAALLLAEAREGLWVRPANLDAHRQPEARAVVVAQCRAWEGRPQEEDPAALAARLWPLDHWAAVARAISARIDAGGDLAERFVVAAAALRHLLADPLLPDELLPEAWPGRDLRHHFDEFYAGYQAELQHYLRR